jgi:hypothetical protein
VFVSLVFPRPSSKNALQARCSRLKARQCLLRPCRGGGGTSPAWPASHLDGVPALGHTEWAGGLSAPTGARRLTGTKDASMSKSEMLQRKPSLIAEDDIQFGPSREVDDHRRKRRLRDGWR